MSQGTCSVEGCSNGSVIRGWCKKHYNRWQRHGDPLVTKIVRTDTWIDRSCSVSGCAEQIKAKALCAAHYGQWKRDSAPRDLCAIQGCTSRQDVRGWCSTHYRRWLRTGDPLTVTYLRGVEPWERLAGKYRVLPTGCWEWTAYRDKYGYGRIGRNGTSWPAYRVAWEHENGPVPQGLHLDHFRYPDEGCIGPPCMNPEHVRPVTPRENILRGESPCAVNYRKKRDNK